MKAIAILLLLSLSGCSSLILRDDDTAAETTGKVVARSLLVLPTFFLSEVAIKKAKRREQFDRQRNDATVYFSSVCEKEGYTRDSAEHSACVSTKVSQAMPEPQTVIVPVQGQQRLRTTCHSSGQFTTCY